LFIIAFNDFISHRSRSLSRRTQAVTTRRFFLAGCRWRRAAESHVSLIKIHFAMQFKENHRSELRRRALNSAIKSQYRNIKVNIRCSSIYDQFIVDFLLILTPDASQHLMPISRRLEKCSLFMPACMHAHNVAQYHFICPLITLHLCFHRAKLSLHCVYSLLCEITKLI
jgi:hypothetical protein